MTEFEPLQISLECLGELAHSNRLGVFDLLRRGEITAVSRVPAIWTMALQPWTRETSSWADFEIAKTSAIRALAPNETTLVCWESHLDTVAEALQISRIESHDLAILVARWIRISAVAVLTADGAVPAMNGVLGLILPRDVATSIGRIFLRAMPTDYVAANLIHPPLAVGVWCRMNVILAHERTPTIVGVVPAIAPGRGPVVRHPAGRGTHSRLLPAEPTPARRRYGDR